MRHAAYLLTLCAAVLAVALCPGRARAEAKLNLGFEDMTPDKSSPQQWVVNKSAGYPFDSVESVLRDPKYVRSGEASVKLVKKMDPQKPDARGHLYTNDEVPVQKDGCYILSLWARGEGEISANAYAYGPGEDGVVKNKGSFYPQPVAGPAATGKVTDTDWQQFQYKFDLAQSKVSITSFRLVIVAAGTVYVDDVEWKQAEEAKP